MKAKQVKQIKSFLESLPQRLSDWQQKQEIKALPEAEQKLANLGLKYQLKQEKREKKAAVKVQKKHAKRRRKLLKRALKWKVLTLPKKRKK